MTLWSYILAKTETLCGQTQDILLLKGTKHQLYLYDKIPMVHRFSCLSYISVQIAHCYRRFANKTINRPHTVATQINIGNYSWHCDVTLVQTIMLPLRCIFGELQKGL